MAWPPFSFKEAIMTKINVGIDAQETNCTQLSIGSYYQITIELENVPQDREGEIENLKERLHCAVTGRDAAETHIERLQEELAFLKAGHDKAAVVKALLAGLTVNGRLQAPPQIEAVRLIRRITGLGVKEAKDLVDAYLYNAPAHAPSCLRPPATAA